MIGREIVKRAIQALDKIGEELVSHNAQQAAGFKVLGEIVTQTGMQIERQNSLLLALLIANYGTEETRGLVAAAYNEEAEEEGKKNEKNSAESDGIASAKYLPGSHGAIVAQ